MYRRSLFLFFLLFVFSSTFSIALSQLALGISVILFVTVVLRERFNPFPKELNRLWISIGLYVGWLILVCLFQDEPIWSLNHIREEWLFVTIPIGAFLMRNQKNLDRMVGALSVGLLLVSLVSLVLLAIGVQYRWGAGFSSVPVGPMQFQGNFAHPLTFGNYAAIAAIFLFGYALAPLGSLNRWVVRLALAGGVVGVAGVLLAGSRGPILALVAGLICLTFVLDRRARWWTLTILVGIAVVVMLIPSMQARFGAGLTKELDPENPRSRVFIWKTSLVVTGENLLIGVGPGNFGQAYSSFLPVDISPIRKYTHAHNDFLQAAARSGIPGAVSFGFLWFMLLFCLWRGRRLAGPDSPWRGASMAAFMASLVFLISSLTEAAFADEEVRTLLMLIWAAGLSVLYKDSTGSMGVESRLTT